MRRLIAVMVAGFALALVPAYAADAPAKPKAAAVAAKAKPGMERMHDVHKNKLGMECNDCHAPPQPVDILLIRKSSMPVDRNACVTCHREPARFSWYGSVAR